MYLYKDQVEYYEKSVYVILEKDIGMILPKFEDRERNVKQKRQIISTLISRFIGLAYKGILGFLQYKQEKALQQGYAYNE